MNAPILLEAEKIRACYGSREIIRSADLHLQEGELVALLGLNGSGKTTMIKLLTRLYEPTEGVIYLNGVDIRKYNYCEYMRLFSVVFQDFSLFDYSIAENVAAGEEYDSAIVQDCLVRAGFGERLAELPEGIETLIGKKYDEAGIIFSGGERQKIAIARALYKDSPFILLDVKYSMVLIVYGVYRVKKKRKIGTAYTNRKKNVYDVTWNRIRKILKSGIGSGSFFIP